MNKDLANLPYFQVPKILLEEPKITGDHIFIFMILYEQLRQHPFDKKGYNKTNENLCAITNIGLTQLKYKLCDLETWGFLERKGMKFSRKFFLGNKFHKRPESIPINQKLFKWPESNLSMGPIPAIHGSNSGYIANNSSKNITNKEIYSLEQKQKYQEYVGRFKSDQNLGLKDKDAIPLAIEEWIKEFI